MTSADVNAFLEQVEPERKRVDSKELAAIMARVTGAKPTLWTGGIVGFGRYHYRYESGHEGDSCLAGFAPRKAAFSIYLMGHAFPDVQRKAQALLRKLGKHEMGKGCLYVKKLGDVNLDVLEELIALSVSTLREHYPA